MASKSDEEFLLYLITDVAKYDHLSARLLFFIFAKRITSFDIDKVEVFHMIEYINTLE